VKIADRIYLIGSGAVGLSDPGDCHVYLIDGGDELAVVDAGCGEGTERLVKNMAADGFDPGAVSVVLLTHAHRDHANGACEIRSRLAERGAPVQVLTSAAEARLLADGTPVELGLDLLGYRGQPRSEVFPPCRVDRTVGDGETIPVGDLEVQAIEVPGHNPGCLCYLVKVGGLRCLLCGDVIYRGGVISLGNWPGSNLQAYRAGLTKLAGQGIDALLPGHGLWTLRDGQTHIDQAIETFAGLWPPLNVNYGAII